MPLPFVDYAGSIGVWGQYADSGLRIVAWALAVPEFVCYRIFSGRSLGCSSADPTQRRPEENLSICPLFAGSTVCAGIFTEAGEMRRMQSGRQRELQDEGCRSVVRGNYRMKDADWSPERTAG